MRKSVAYKVDVCLQPSGVVIEAQYECGAGQGPSAHCKHVVALLYGLMKFRPDGEIITEQTWTQTLQTFHKTKTYKGSPMKCKTLQVLRGQTTIHYDSRRPEFRNLKGKMDSLQNLCINRKMENMPLMLLFPPANPTALTTDHDYCSGDDADLFLNRENIYLTDDDREEIEKATRDQSACKLWKSEHQKRITSSNFGRICKIKTADKDLMARSIMNSKGSNSPWQEI